MPRRWGGTFMWPYTPAIVVAIGATIVVAGSFWQGVRQSSFNAEIRAKNEKIIQLQTSTILSVTGGYNYAFITIMPNAPKNPEVPLMMVNEGYGAVYNVRYWIYPGVTQTSPPDKRYSALGLKNGFDWVNPGRRAATPLVQTEVE
jgi:hypothetical protein